MEDKFLELPKEKQLRIINAGMEYFGKYGYKNARTDDIAARAGISKGLLFYYFKNKKSFFIYLFHFCEDILKQFISIQDVHEITDFFDIMDYGAVRKMEIMIKYPYMLNFILKAFYSQKEDVSHDMNYLAQKILSQTFDNYFQNIDMSKFKEDIDVRQVYQMLVWMMEGYLVDMLRNEQSLDVDEMLTEFEKWKVMFKRMCYREEYL
ncbi:TetR/AcrR family transcriptional regulator [Candidatus Stoquefichus massiliensis]|uniref:TetR/AcrR family transcriptional regulator n=1 Tax=Candidatus Stoquefichus massiliensis TaxID=1470350 RepID=UPI00048762A0|nr:TetR/AcrR family transcriptional regulator [Candidatus Stoquefichus massiliensis]